MIFHLLFYLLLTVISVCDYKEHKIPNRLTVMILILGAAQLFWIGSGEVFAGKVIGAIVTPLPFILCNFLRSRAFGGGDLKLLAACGWFLGWKLAFVGLAASVLCCGIYCVAGIVLLKISKKTIIAYGPFISLGMAIAGLFGEKIIFWYIS